MGAAIGQAISSTGAFLLGRRTYEQWAAFWPEQSPEENPIAGAINGLPKKSTKERGRSPSFREPAAVQESGRRNGMAVYSIWESRFPPEHIERGREVTDAIWQEMPVFPGYLRHVLIEDLDDPGHLFVVSEWESREAADEVLAEYASNSNARLANELVAEPRPRTVGRRLGPEA
jgi:quinol monooxygenase YgiN